MTNLAESRTLPQAATRRSRRISIIWIVPLVAVAIGGWLAWDTLSKEGPTIKIAFDGGEGLQAGQSQLKYKDIVFGTVKSLALSPDQTHVVVTVATTRQAEPLLTEGTAFWVVKPRLFAGNVSGIETLLSGSYIGMLPAATAGKSQREFVGREDPPVLGAHVPGRTFLLKSKRLGAVSVGSPIFYRDLNVGEVLGWDIADMAEYVTIHAFVRAPYDSYVHDQTRFWNASGVSVKLGGTGVEVQMESLKACSSAASRSRREWRISIRRRHPKTTSFPCLPTARRQTPPLIRERSKRSLTSQAQSAGSRPVQKSRCMASRSAR